MALHCAQLGVCISGDMLLPKISTNVAVWPAELPLREVLRKHPRNVLLARTLYQQKVNVAGFFSILGGGFNYKFVKEMPDVSQYMMDVNHWYNPRSDKANALKKRVEATGGAPKDLGGTAHSRHRTHRR